jgi:hypothetical protein
MNRGTDMGDEAFAVPPDKGPAIAAEQAAVPFVPVDASGGKESPTDAVIERVLGLPGVVGAGESRTATGDPAVVVYLETGAAGPSIPDVMLGVPIEKRVTGPIDAQ